VDITVKNPLTLVDQIGSPMTFIQSNLTWVQTVVAPVVAIVTPITTIVVLVRRTKKKRQ